MRGFRFALASTLVCWGCSSSDFAVGDVTDASVSDSGGTSSDTGGAVTDSGALADSGGTVSDSGGTVDSGGGTTEGGVLDVGVDVGSESGTMCPRPPSTATFDFSTTGCDALQTAYVDAVNAAKTCTCDADCSTKLYDSLCKNCESFVSPANDAYPRAKAILDEWNTRVASGACTPPPCPLGLCAPPTLSGCHGTGSGTPRTCLKK